MDAIHDNSCDFVRIVVNFDWTGGNIASRKSNDLFRRDLYLLFGTTIAWGVPSKRLEGSMRTSEDAGRSGLYASECCAEELVFYKHDTFWRCPRCRNLCEWELVEGALSPYELESMQEAEPALASVR